MRSRDVFANAREREWLSFEGSKYGNTSQKIIINSQVGEDKTKKSQNRYFLANNPKQNSDCMTKIISFSQSRSRARLAVPISEQKNFSETDPPI